MVQTPHKTKRVGLHPQIDFWSWGAVAIFLLMMAPIASVLWSAVGTGISSGLQITLPRYFANSLMLMLLVGFGTMMIGTITAWLIATKTFPGKGIFEWALLLPLALPAYISAFVMVELLEFAGPIQTFLRDLTGTRVTWFPEIRSLGGAALLISLSLYPYVYLFSRTAFREQSVSLQESARLLGCGPMAVFWRVGLPMARPAIVAGVALTMMEALNDFGTVEFFAVQTLTTGIFTEWLESGNRAGAAQIAASILALVAALVFVERTSRARRRFYHAKGAAQYARTEPLTTLGTTFALIVCTLPILIGFIFPVMLLINHAFAKFTLSSDLIHAALNTLHVAGLAALITTLLALIMGYGVRLTQGQLPRRLAPLSGVGYAVPGAVLALGVLIPLSRLDNAQADFWLLITGHDPGLLLTGTSFAVILAYCIRFFAIAQGGIDAAFGRISPNVGMASRSLGQNATGTFRWVHLPLMRGSILTVLILVFLDAVKELPATLLLRPFGFSTLATLTYDKASLEDIAGASLPALAIVAVSLIAVIIAAASSKK